ncbi:SMI1/KNR4 family protein [Streptomyces sp. SID13726]|uniref:SMI1/KNR4 family protein n=1 Tax=Streptomyces sp. SID13726 TaxID=2706058 RepID=UPI0013BE7EC6|nr:SMI1/KNR4 family protein [Streptomyces sp. SID13726]NEB00987.1 SMI1/KNR4 family protein [Streptomyces sp. SID13726]
MTEAVSGSTAATSADVARARAEIALSLPTPLVELWEVTDGLMTDAGVTVYAAECIGERNSTYEVAQYAPGFVLIGDNSGGRGFLLRADGSDSAVFSSDLGDLAPDDFEVEALDFASWIESLGSEHFR